MDINTNQQLNIAQTSSAQSKTSVQNPQIADDKKFAAELSKAEKEKNKEVPESKDKKEENKSVKPDDKVKAEEKANGKKVSGSDEKSVKDKKETKTDNKDEEIDNAIFGLKDAVTEINKINQKEENEGNEVKQFIDFTDKEESKIEDNNLIDNNMNIQDPSEKINLQTETGANFTNNGQPFSEFINQESKADNLRSTDKELSEEKAILSTMEENVAIARKNMLLKEKNGQTDKENSSVQQKNITVQNDEGIKKVNTQTHITVETIVSYDNVVMDKADVDFFVNLVENGAMNISDVQNAQKSAHVSKTLADLLAKAMNENKPVRIDFDNDISVIIKIDRAGKISADFLPSSQVAEAYLRENLPLLRQKFDDNNIDYNELNQRKQKQDTPDNRKKGRKDE